MAGMMLLLWCLILLTVAIVAEAGPVGLVAGSRFHRLLVVLLENIDYDTALQNEYFKKLIAKPNTRLLTHYHAVSGATQGNYVSIVAGGTYNTSDNQIYDLDGPVIVDKLESRNISWRSYHEGYPGNCSAVAYADYRYFLWPAYTREHNPLINFRGIREDQQRCSNVRNAADLDADMASGQLPQVMFYIPDQFHNGHYYGVGPTADWLQQWLEPKLKSPSFKNTAVLIASVNQPSTTPKQVLALILGDVVAHRSSDDHRYSHYSISATIEDNWNLEPLSMEDESAHPFRGLSLPANRRGYPVSRASQGTAES